MKLVFSGGHPDATYKCKINNEEFEACKLHIIASHIASCVHDWIQETFNLCEVTIFNICVVNILPTPIQ